MRERRCAARALVRCLLGLTGTGVLGPTVAVAQEVETVYQAGHTRIYATAFSPDGQYLLTGGFDAAKLWDFSSGKLIRTHAGHNHMIQAVAFTRDGKRFATVSRDETAIIWETETGRVLHTLALGGFANAGAFNPDGSLLLTGDAASAKIWDTQTGRLLRTIGQSYSQPSGSNDDCLGKWGRAADFSPDGSQVVVACMGTLGGIYDAQTGARIAELEDTGEAEFLVYGPNGDYIAGAVKLDSGEYRWPLLLWDAETGTKARLMGLADDSDTDGAKPESIAFSPDGITIITGSQEETAKIYAISLGDLINELPLSDPVEAVAYSPDGKHVVTGAGGEITVWDWMTGEALRKIGEEKVDYTVRAIDFSPDMKYLYTGSEQNTAHMWDLGSGRLVRSFTGHKGFISSVDVSPDGKHLLTTSADDTAALWVVETGEQERDFYGAGGSSAPDIIAAQYSPDGNYIAFAHRDKTASLFSVVSGSTTRTYEGHTDRLIDVAWSPDSKRIATSSADNTVIIWEVSSQKALHTLTSEHDVFALDFSPDGRYVATAGEDDTTKLWDANSGRLVRTYKRGDDPVMEVGFSPDGKHLLTSHWDGAVVKWEVSSGKEVFSKRTPDNAHQVNFSPDGKYFATAWGSGKIWDAATNTEIASLASTGDDNYVISTPAGYYTASKGAMEVIHFAKGLKAYDFENFDLIFNRPDKVVQQLGMADDGVVQIYKKAFEKRLKKMGFAEDELSTDMHVPEIEIVSDLSTFETDEDSYTFTVSITDSKYKLDRINLYVNDVPVYGVKGMSLRAKGVSETTREIAVQLSAGANKIQVSAHNEKAAESLKETLDINCTKEAEKPDLYVLAIGVSEYQQDKFNLVYAAKDAEDLTALFADKTDLYGQIHTRVITDKEATTQNIKKAKEFLMDSGVDDQVILFVAGHGLVSDELDYYFATHDIDFLDPAAAGLPYEEIEDLVDGIPARKKLVLMDTCHSGEIEKEEVQLAKVDDVSVSVRSFRGLGIVPKLGAVRTNDLLKELFSDLRRGTGAMVITSSSGSEYSFENDEFKNGVFTYAIIDGLENGTAGAAGAITISAMESHVSDRVRVLTNGAQNPTMRRENLEYDFVIY